jgi:hypothetical protein
MVGCTDTVPCANCPAVDGVYDVTWGNPDAGTLSDGGVCAAQGPRPIQWTLAQRSSNVTTTIANVNMGGTIYDTYDMVLTGSDTGISYRLRALTIPSGGTADAGIRLDGTFTTRNLATDEPCDISEAFTAQRVSR